MKITLAESAGFCFGVKRAIEICRKTAREFKNIEMLGDIVHNEAVINDIKQNGIKKIRRLTRGKNKILIIRAHGSAATVYKKARQLGYKIIDATCPMVHEIHKIVKNMEKEGYKIIIIGDKKHDEVKGIVGQLKKKAIVINPSQKIPWKKLKRRSFGSSHSLRSNSATASTLFQLSLIEFKKAAAVVQSTQRLEKITPIVEQLRRYIKELKFFNTICKPTLLKQKEIQTLPLQNEIMLIIGSKTSANTKRLYEISKSLNKRTHWIQSKKDLNKKWFKGIKSAGITSGASTPNSITQEIIQSIKRGQATFFLKK